MKHRIVAEEAIGTSYVIHCGCGEFKGIGSESIEALQAFLDHQRSV
jgi:hypothetical protein